MYISLLLIIKLSFVTANYRQYQILFEYDKNCCELQYHMCAPYMRYQIYLYEMYKQGTNVRLSKHFTSLSWQVHTKFEPVTEVKLQYEVNIEDFICMVYK
jgi:hypothetical protein